MPQEKYQRSSKTPKTKKTTSQSNNLTQHTEVDKEWLKSGIFQQKLPTCKKVKTGIPQSRS